MELLIDLIVMHEKELRAGSPEIQFWFHHEQAMQIWEKLLINWFIIMESKYYF